MIRRIVNLDPDKVTKNGKPYVTVELEKNLRLAWFGVGDHLFSDTLRQAYRRRFDNVDVRVGDYLDLRCHGRNKGYAVWSVSDCWRPVPEPSAAANL